VNKPTAESTGSPTDGLECYEVGGAVRDALLGLPVQDRDWVVVGATPEQMQARGFTPVGRDFPVFLHPSTHEEYALARTERKTGPGYRGFVVHCAPEVTLEADLLRRDLTVNAIARAPEGRLVDPYGGQADLQARLLRHVSPAFVEDPVRILRVARFCARFTEFKVAPDTASLMRAMVERGEVDALVPERVWQEVSRGLMRPGAPRMFDVLQACGALERLMPELAPHWSQPGHQDAMWRASHDTGADLAVRWAVLHAGLSPKAAIASSARVRAPQTCADLARLLCSEGPHLGGVWASERDALGLLERCDALRKPERFHRLLQAARLLDPHHASALRRWQQAADAAGRVPAGTVVQGVPAHPTDTRTERIREALTLARCAAIAQAIAQA
jgi:tRNA nucleotidyltransferase (CCA-adding enzyme)